MSVSISAAQAASASVAAVRAHSKAGRNVAIDALRGFCIVMMIGGHIGTSTITNQSIHFLRFVSGAEGFVFLAGLVLGLVYGRKLRTGPALPVYKAIWRRAWMIYVVHCCLVVLAVVANQAWFRYPDMPATEQLGIGRFIWLTATLRFQPPHGLNILPLYVFLLAATPAVLELLKRRLVALVLVASVGTLVWTQYQPGVGAWVHESCGGDAFPPLSWQGLFIPAVCAGYYYHTIRDRFVAPSRAVLQWMLSLALVVWIVVVWVQPPTFAFEFYNHATWDPILWERHPLRLGRVAYFLLSIGAFYLIAQACMHRSKLSAPLFHALAVMGKNSLYCFLVHLVIAFPLASVKVPPEQWILAEGITIGSVLLIYFMAKYQVARRWIPN